MASISKKASRAILGKLGFQLVRVKNQSEPLPGHKNDDFVRLKNSFTQYENIKIHLGCGPRVLKNWINIDLVYEPYENYLKYYKDAHYPEHIRGTLSDFFSIDITNSGLPLPDNSVDLVFHEDFLEHLNQRDQVILLAETLRVLKPGGVHRVNTPDLCHSMNTHSNFKQGKLGVFVDEWNRHGHLSVLTPNTLKEMAQLVGYSKVILGSRNISQSKQIPSEYRPDPNDRPEAGNIFADLIK